MRKEMLAVGLALTLVATAFGASAFTSATVNTESNMDVVADSNALIGLQDTSSGNIVETEGQRLVINASNSRADGLNQNATVTLGNYDAIGNTASDWSPDNASAAFSITNNAANTQTFQFNYTDGSASLTGDSVENVNFTVVDPNSGVVGSVNETSGAEISGVSSGQTRYVLMKIDTTGIDANGALNGTFTASATSSASA